MAPYRPFRRKVAYKHGVPHSRLAAEEVFVPRSGQIWSHHADRAIPDERASLDERMNYVKFFHDLFPEDEKEED